MNPRLALTALLFAASLSSLAVRASQPPAPRFEFVFGGSFTSEGDADYAGRTNGTVETRSIRGSMLFRDVATETLRYRLGVGFEQFTIDATSGVPVPERLQSQFIDLGATWQVTPGWALSASVQPGLFADTEASSDDSLAAPAMLLALWQPSPRWTLGAGIRYHTLGRNELVPVLTARWQMSPAWALSLGAPRTEIAFTFDRDTTFFAGASFEGGAFAVDDPALVAPAGYPSLRDTRLEFREIRAGVGLRRQFAAAARLQLEAGAAIDRRFEYFDRSLKIEADSAGFVALSLVISH